MSLHTHSDPVVGTLVIDRRLYGPRRSANGGFAAGSISRSVDADVVTVRLHKPVPLGRGMNVVATDDGGIRVVDGARTIASAYPGTLADADPPPAPSYRDAVLARAAHPLAGMRHPLSDCFVCGPHRPDGMHVTPGFAPDRADMLVAPWVVGADVSGSGIAHLAAVWGAIDCTSYPAHALRTGELCLLGTMTALVERRPRVGEKLVVYSWTRSHERRRYETSAVMVDADGAVVARADATWIAVRHQRLHALRVRRRPAPRVSY